jgi:hypothetical protein
MSNPAMLNLDDLVADTKSIVYKGATHTSVEMTVETYLERVKAANALKAAQSAEGETLPVSAQIEQSITMVHETFPTFPVEEIRTLSLQRMTALIAYVLASPKDIAEGVEKAAATETPAPNA